jgi:octopine/nopaline transport system permease protein
MNLTLMWESVPKLLAGVPVALQLVGLSLLFGLVLAIAVAAARLSRNIALSGLASAYIFVFRGTPLLVQIFLIYYGLGQFPAVRESFLWPILRDSSWCAVLALTLNTAAYTSEMIRGGVQSVPYGQVEAARALGMSRALILRRVIAPIALRQALPAYGNEVILMVKASSLASTITILEITGIARRLIAQTYAVFEIFIVAGAIYLVLNFLITRLVKAVEWRLTPHLRRAA